ncbi:hypothetical protein KR032_008950 [Drosophila birchii]|nr:hypothetical protein KR032_008950 [Drosophila birchii]
MGGPVDAIIVSRFNLRIHRRDLHTLIPGQWINDEIINFYFNMLTERSEQRSGELPSVYAYSTFFMNRLMLSGYQGVRRWTRRVDVFSKDLLIFPFLYDQQLWCLAIVDLRHKAIRYFDSLAKSDPAPVLNALASYLTDELLDKRQQVLDLSGWDIGPELNLPLQTNNTDSGVFTCVFAEYITRNTMINFTQSHMNYFRKRLVLEIAHAKFFQ